MSRAPTALASRRRATPPPVRAASWRFSSRRQQPKHIVRRTKSSGLRPIPASTTKKACAGMVERSMVLMFVGRKLTRPAIAMRETNNRLVRRHSLRRLASHFGFTAMMLGMMWLESSVTVLESAVAASAAPAHMQIPASRRTPNPPASSQTPSDTLKDLAVKIGIAFLGAALGVGGTVLANRWQNCRRDLGVLAQISATLSVIETHLRKDDGKRPLPRERFSAIEDLFKSAYSTDTAVALKATRCDIARLYDALMEARTQCETLTQIWSEYKEFQNALRQGNYHQTGAAKHDAYMERHEDASSRALSAIA